MNIETNFPNYVQFNGLELSGELEEFSITLQKKKKKIKKIRVLSAYFYILRVQMISNLSH